MAFDSTPHKIIGADCITDHYLVAAKVRNIFAVSTQAVQKFDA